MKTEAGKMQHMHHYEELKYEEPFTVSEYNFKLMTEIYTLTHLSCMDVAVNNSWV